VFVPKKVNNLVVTFVGSMFLLVHNDIDSLVNIAEY
jgi:hypothetical protein